LPESLFETNPFRLNTHEPLAGTEVSVLGSLNAGLQGNEIKPTFGYVNADSGMSSENQKQPGI
jgi:hypothetical protein|tara:strand:- start:81 stop:269 length:189 start_codon:yes stop_codon:yes gene_type:complete